MKNIVIFVEIYESSSCLNTKCMLWRAHFTRFHITIPYLHICCIYGILAPPYRPSWDPPSNHLISRTFSISIFGDERNPSIPIGQRANEPSSTAVEQGHSFRGHSARIIPCTHLELRRLPQTNAIPTAKEKLQLSGPVEDKHDSQPSQLPTCIFYYILLIYI